MKLFFLLLLVVHAKAKIVIEKWDIQIDSKYGEVKKEIKDGKYVSMDVHCNIDADDVLIEAAAYSKVDGSYNPFVRPDPIHICKVHEHEDPLVQFMHEEIMKFGNVTKACPLKKGDYYYVHDFTVDESKFPMPLPEGEFRMDVNGSIVVQGVTTHIYSSECYFKTMKD